MSNIDWNKLVKDMSMATLPKPKPKIQDKMWICMVCGYWNTEYQEKCRNCK